MQHKIKKSTHQELDRIVTRRKTIRNQPGQMDSLQRTRISITNQADGSDTFRYCTFRH